MRIKEATIFYPKTLKHKNPAILFINGWGNDKKSSYPYAAALSEIGFICFLFDLRNDSNLSNKDYLDDVLAAYDYLLTIDGVDSKNISSCGLSFGGYLACLLTSKRKIKNLVLRVPSNYPDELFEKPVRLSSGKIPKVLAWRKKIKKLNESKALKAMHNFNGNILIIESELDEKIPHEVIESYVYASNKNKLTHIVMKNTPHISSGVEFVNSVKKFKVDWFKQRI